MNLMPFVLPLFAAALVAQGHRSLAIPVQQPAGLPVPVVAGAPAAVGERAPVATLAAMPPTLLASGLDAVVFDRPEPDGALWALGENWKASFDGAGFAYHPCFGAEAPRNFPLRVELVKATVGETTLSLTAGRPEVRGAAVHTPRGALVEVVDTALASLEQSWVFAELPQRAAVAVEVRLQGEYEVAANADGLRFGNAHGVVEYRGAMALDAAGKRLPLAIEWLGDRARIVIPAAFVAAAQLPLVLDPVLTSNPSLAPGLPVARAQRSPDIASVGPNRVTCVVWNRSWSATDEDVVVQLLGADLTPLGAAQYVDFTAENWLFPRVAPNNNSQSFLCVAQVDANGLAWIAGRLCTAAGGLGAQFPIDKAGVAGHLGGNKYRPDVGGDPYVFAGNTAAFYTVVFEHEAAPGNRDVYCKQVNQDGSLRHVAPIALHTSAANETHPAIGVCNGPGTLSNRMLVAWQGQKSVAPFDDDIWGAYVEWNGNVLIPAFQITNAPRPERNPAVSSIANVAGADHLLLAYEEDWTSDNDVMLRVMDWSGNTLRTSSLSNTMAGGAHLLRNQVAPSVDSDGTRFVVGFSEANGTDYDTYAVTLAYLPGNTTLRIDDDRVALGTATGVDEFGTSVFADFSGSSIGTLRNEYVIAGANLTGNDIEVRRYGGHVGGPSFWPYPTQCGTLTISATGVPAIGNRITFALNANWWQFAGFVFGFPAATGLGVCNCTLGVTSVANVPGSVHSWTVPRDPALVGGFTLSIQGFALGGTACLGNIDLSDTLDFQLR